MGKMYDAAKKIVGGGGVTCGLEKVKIDDLIKKYPNGVAVNGFDIIPYNGGTFPSFTFLENAKQCFSGGKALKELVEGWIELCDGDIGEANENLAKAPVIIQMSKVRTKTGRTFTKVEVVGEVDMGEESELGEESEEDTIENNDETAPF